MIAIFVVKIFAFEILEVNALLHCTHTYDAAARLLIAKTVANESKT